MRKQSCEEKTSSTLMKMKETAEATFVAPANMRTPTTRNVRGQKRGTTAGPVVFRMIHKQIVVSADSLDKVLSECNTSSSIKTIC